ncbi:destrin, actin depolymerizing factor S homeolog [Xenopus laevis]|uniref:Destrin, actin depolymerizing factor S homeolog n=2 Tax=Xenopus laevis TaxID=8355 RepID=Q7ZXD4_XENLA|nr:destrin, actin depolymerizing factor S homeolog [Xenopus laevis]AAH45044.1 MGC53245 protein [Xenopus laevis]OCT77803.1 hypothetical protein XELAEV_18028899mg [Xenopus laevis]
MASGVRIDDCISAEFQEMKLRKSKKKVIFFCFTEDEKFITLDKEKEILVDHKGDFFQTLKSMFPEKKCCYALIDVNYSTGETLRQDLMFVMWTPDTATIKQKMLFASSKSSLKQALPGVQKQWEIQSREDLTLQQLAEKISNSKIKCLEGHNL